MTPSARRLPQGRRPTAGRRRCTPVVSGSCTPRHTGRAFGSHDTDRGPERWSGFTSASTVLATHSKSRARSGGCPDQSRQATVMLPRARPFDDSPELSAHPGPGSHEHRRRTSVCTSGPGSREHSRRTSVCSPRSGSRGQRHQHSRRTSFCRSRTGSRSLWQRQI